LQLKAQEQQRKQAKDQTDAQLRQMQIQVEQSRVAAQAQTDRARIAADAMKVESNRKVEAMMAAAHMQDDREKMMTKLGVDVLKQLSTQNHQEKINRQKPPTKGK
jgi:predicted regulator of amino acid metabolism with ACT domain